MSYFIPSGLLDSDSESSEDQSPAMNAALRRIHSGFPDFGSSKQVFKRHEMDSLTASFDDPKTETSLERRGFFSSEPSNGIADEACYNLYSWKSNDLADDFETNGKSVDLNSDFKNSYNQPIQKRDPVNSFSFSEFFHADKTSPPSYEKLSKNVYHQNKSTYDNRAAPLLPIQNLPLTADRRYGSCLDDTFQMGLEDFHEGRPTTYTVPIEKCRLMAANSTDSQRYPGYPKKSTKTKKPKKLVHDVSQ